MTDEQYDPAGDVAALASINAKLAELTEVRDSIKERITAHVTFGTYDVGNLKLTIRHNRRLNVARFMARYSPDEHPALFKPAPDSAAIKQYLAPADTADLYDEGAPVVVIG